MKYPRFDFKNVELIFTVDTDHGTYEVYKVDPLRRYYLVKNGRDLAWKNYSSISMTFKEAEKWVAKWRKNAKFQIEQLDERIADLQLEQAEIRFLIDEKIE